MIKHVPNAFINTGLEQILREKQISQLIICGMMSHMCIDTSVRAAKDAGFEVMLAEDACTTKPLQWEGTQVPAQTVHNVIMASLSGTFARVLKTSEVLTSFEKH